MKSFKSIVLVSSLVCSMNTFADSAASEHSVLASKHSALASSHATASTLKVASAAVAVPLVIAGSASIAVGSAINASGDKVSKTIETFDKPLVVTHTVITAGPPPNQAVKHKKSVEIVTKKTVIESTQ
ncbi:hypothetical protein [Agaribacter marinus]|uniref:Lipoprotein n=1 Tax=Agaribacter marinus TaxID=1431249 RepID=A0AA37T0R1_9ALTE|nr:hypothetical protein [Agaribacter marinus]GLR72742.1 hypothetical protein GCM10007852_36500 [Agaribacter marinus]